MISTNSQCTVHAAPMLPAVLPTLPPLEIDTLPDSEIEADTLDPTAEADEDEGFSEISDMQALELMIREQEQEQAEQAAKSLCEASTPSGVRKYATGRHPLSVRFRSQYHRAGRESSTGPNETPRESGKVRCATRMRRRKPIEPHREDQ